MKEYTKRILSIATAFSIFAGTIGMVAAADSPVQTTTMKATTTNEVYKGNAVQTNALKEEVVYVNLNHDGSVENIYVVNGFTTNGTGEIVDYGDYESVKNLSTLDNIQPGAGMVLLPISTEKQFYQGNLKSKETPWNLSVAYTLDGKPVSGEELAGSSGHLEIDISIKQNENMDEVYQDHFALQGSITLDGEKISNLSAPDATVANSGSDKLLSYIILPGKDEDLKISVDVKDFEMGGMMFNALPLTLNIDDPDTEELKDRVRELQDGAIELDDGAVELDDGATKLGDGVATLQDGVNTLKDGVEELTDGTDELYDGTSDLVSGVNKLKKGANDLDSGAQAVNSGAKAISGALDQLNENSAELANGAAALSGGISQLNSAMSDINEDSITQFGEKSAALRGGSDAYLAALNEQIDSLEATIRQLSTIGLGASGGEVNEYAIGQADALSQTLGMLYALRDNYIPINAGVGEYTAGVESMAPALLKAKAGMQQLQSASERLYGGVNAYTGGVGALAEKAAEFAAGTSDLADGAEKLKDGASELKGGADELHEGAYDLKDGSNKLADGTTLLGDGVTELSDGAVDLKDGTIELVDGTHELRDETADMDTEVDDKIDEILDEYRSSDFDIPSFADSRNTNIASLQFVIRTPDIKIPDDMPDSPSPIEMPEVPTTFKERFLALFIK